MAIRHINVTGQKQQRHVGSLKFHSTYQLRKHKKAAKHPCKRGKKTSSLSTVKRLYVQSTLMQTQIIASASARNTSGREAQSSNENNSASRMPTRITTDIVRSVMMKRVTKVIMKRVTESWDMGAL